jgi:hypothetical protein
VIQSARITGHTRQYRESGFVLVPHTDVSAYQNVATCANGRFDGPHCSIKNVGRMAAMGRKCSSTQEAEAGPSLRWTPTTVMRTQPPQMPMPKTQMPDFLQ